MIVAAPSMVYIAYFVFRTARERCHTQYALRNANNPYSSADTSLSTATAASARDCSAVRTSACFS